MAKEGRDFLADRWKLLLLLLWIGTCAVLLFYRWQQIQWFALADTDDNMRLMQVRAWLSGQSWYDLRNYRLNPPTGLNIHWSRLVDLPIAALILVAKPFVGGAMAEKFAVAIAPMIPLGVVFVGLGLTARRLIAPQAALLAVGIFCCMVTAMGMFLPTRIDHHGWQLAMLTIVLAGLADPRAARGGVTVGIASALSLVIGLETLPWLAIAGGAVGLRWVWNGEAERLRGYASALGLGSVAGFFMFASNDNWGLRCDALTPIWLSVMVFSSLGIWAISALPAKTRVTRLAATAVLGAALLLYFTMAWPDCLGRPEQVSPELQKLWLNNISEAKPIYTRNLPTILAASALLLGLFGSFWLTWVSRREERFGAWATIALMSLGSALMLLWQARAAPTALMFSVPGAAAIGWAVLPRMRAHRSVLMRTFGYAAAFLLVSGLWVQLLAGALPDGERAKPGMKRVAKANASCPSIPALRPIAKMPKATILTFVDLGPRLVTMTHHNALAGPYHRNERAILDVHRAWRGTADDARDVMKRHGATMLLICPNLSESTVYRSESPKGFYVALADGIVPSWLEPVTLPANSPYRLWRLKE